ncbi:Protein of unknown function [Lachnospiraceae bacterium NE2001]|nr:Protein of unknown function [Lachnospiraceae bacterium NE2001]
MNKDIVISKMKKGSLIIGIICITCALLESIISISYLSGAYTRLTDEQYTSDSLAYMNQYAFLKNGIAFCIVTIVMLISAIMFITISRNGAPFANKNAQIIRVIGILTILEGFIPSTIAIIVLGYHQEFLPTLFSPVNILIGLLFVFLAYVIKYGAILQQESDETI